MMIALNQDPWARRLFLITVFHFDDSPSAKRRDHLLFLVNRFRFRVIKNGGIGFSVDSGNCIFLGRGGFGPKTFFGQILKAIRL